jgi:molybdopterin-guanine dinucleotide biosynthesis protein A
MRVRMISEKKILEKDPELTSFLNINTPEDLAACGNQKR